MYWWIRPLMRIVAAFLLPLIVPLVISGILWALPGDPIDIMCPPGTCTGQQQMAERLCMDHGRDPIDYRVDRLYVRSHDWLSVTSQAWLPERLHPWLPVAYTPETALHPLEFAVNTADGSTHFYSCWLPDAVQGEFGRSLRVSQGERVAVLLWQSLPTTATLVGVALAPVFGLSLLAATGLLPRRLDGVWAAIGIVPSVILALLAAAFVTISFGVDNSWTAETVRLVLGAAVLATADGTLAGAVIGTRSVFDEEIKARYVQISMLRGESTFVNALPNVTPALIGQFRGRILHILSGAVIVEVVLGISGLGDLLWDGTLLQDFPVVLAAAFAFSLLSGLLLFSQALAEVGIEMYVRMAPTVPLDEGVAA